MKKVLKPRDKDFVFSFYLQCISELPVESDKVDCRSDGRVESRAHRPCTQERRVAVIVKIS